MNNTEKTIVFVSSTKRDDLCCISAYINPEEQHDASAKSDYHWQILKCRQIIFKNDDVIASPVLGNQKQIQIIMRKHLYGTGKIQELLEKLKMPGHRLQQLTNSIYESCLRYTIIARIAPQWNQVQSYLIQGRQFLVANGPLSAIKLELEVKEESMYVVLSPTKVSMHGLTLEDLNIPPALSQKFTPQSNTSIHDITMGAKWVHVLPSMKRGRIITISNQIPNSCPYLTYKDLRRHWKNSYGYRLPESDEGIFYSTISFHPMIPTKYTYPSICLKSAPLQFMGRSDERKIMSAFLTDLTKKFAYACGDPFRVLGGLGYTIPKSMEQIKENIHPSATLLESQTGLLPKPILSTAGLGILSIPKMSHDDSGDADLSSMQSSCGVSLTTPRANILGESPFSSALNNTTQSCRNNSWTSLNNGAAKMPELPIEKSISNNISAIIEIQQKNGSTMNSDISLERNANFRTLPDANAGISAMKQTTQRCTAVSMIGRSQPITESAFASYTSQSASTPGKVQTEFIEPAHAAVSSTLLGRHIPTTSSMLPRHMLGQPGLSSKQHVIQQESQHKKYVPNFSAPSMQRPTSVPVMPTVVPKKYAPVFAPPAISGFQSSQISKATAKSTSVTAGFGSTPMPRTPLPDIEGANIPQTQRVAAQSSSSISKVPLFGVQTVSKAPNSMITKVPLFGVQTVSKAPNSMITKVPSFGTPVDLNCTNAKEAAFGKVSVFENRMASKSSTTPKNERPPPAPTRSHNKRKPESTPFPAAEMSSSGTKKPRSRPKVQTDVNIETMARSQNLALANATTLINWLREKSVPCTTKESKSALMARVKNHLGIKE